MNLYMSNISRKKFIFVKFKSLGNIFLSKSSERNSVPTPTVLGICVCVCLEKQQQQQHDSSL